jgi:hypothetical protein
VVSTLTGPPAAECKPNHAAPILGYSNIGDVHNLVRLLSGPDQAARLGLTASVFGTRTVSQGSKRLSNERVQRALRLRLRSDAKRCSARRPRKAHKLAGVRGRGQAGEIALHTGISDSGGRTTGL